MSPGQDEPFVVEEPTVDPSSGEIVLHYTCGAEQFAERWVIGEFDQSRLTAVERTVRLLAVCASTSYYKAVHGAPFHVPFSTSHALIEGLLGPGLSEFRWTNFIDFDARPVISVSSSDPLHDAVQPRNSDMNRALVALGGGKDSLVAATALAGAGRDVTLCAINPKSPMTWTSHALDMPLIGVTRRIDPYLLELNERGAPNGHIPITAITSAGLLVVAAARGFDEVVFANESSASVPTFFTGDGSPINHQYSKSLSFETVFANEVQRLGLPIAYYSAIRALTELAVCRVVAGLPTHVQDSFTSCNRNFHLSGAGRNAEDRWCGECSKCAFVFLCLAPFVGRLRLVELFGKDLFLDSDLESTYFELASNEGVRPLECIGTAEEVRWALHHSLATGDWADAEMLHDLVGKFPEIEGFDPFDLSGVSMAPEAIAQVLAELVAQRD